ncbi:ferredoxin--NADP reductase [Olleya sp. UBA1516]|uniref:ferredoxin--NADP reductase n=1 Tax=Olleya sp. UBA1516 TaxID=1947013 RepID=UPI0025DD8146|nr:ferredoxin--NADP reductase [Olleya sp. UBA1516]|tara:strand:+ start:52284 stop:53357 length:1074 start_codon:yes stop_codon:yes gene_type:complete
MANFHQLKVLEVKKETKHATSIAFDVPMELYETFNYKPGQYLTLKFNINGEEVRRSYSLCSSPALEEPLRVGVKRVKDGLVSNHINDNIKVGDLVDVMPPDGRFFADVKKDNYKTYYLFSAGSGITPILSILRTVLFTEARSYVYMIYGNRTEESIMFKQELDALQEKYGDRFILEYTLSRPKSSWSDLWKTSNEHIFRKGRVDAEAVKWFINEYPLYAQNTEYYICGPGTMIENTKKALKTIDVPDERIFIESFGANASKDTTEAFENAKLTANLNGETIQVSIPKGKTVLRTLIDAGKKPPYSCEGGVCSTCMCKLKSGKIHMKNNLALTDKEVEQGYILSCQSIPLTESIEIEY